MREQVALARGYEQLWGMTRSFAETRALLAAIWSRVGEGHFGLIAAGVAFYAMFAIFPGIAASVAIWSLVSDPVVIATYLNVGEKFLPTDAASLVHDQVMGLLTAPKAALGWATFVSVGIALYSARAGVAALISGLDVVHRARPRGFLWGMLIDFTLTFALIFALLFGLATVVAVPLILNYISLGALEGWIVSVLPWVAMALLVLTCLSILYRFGPNLPQDVQSRWVSAGVIVATIGWSGVSLAFSTYLANFDSYNKIYGSIGAVIALLMWLYLSAWVILLGGAVNAELTHRNSPQPSE